MDDYRNKPITSLSLEEVKAIEDKAGMLMSQERFNKNEGDYHEVGCPLVCVIHGPGGCGKDEFISQVRRAKLSARNLRKFNIYCFSAIDTVKRACEIMIGPKPEKTDTYRQFLHEVKMSWEKLYNGPNNDMLSSIYYVLGLMKRDLDNYNSIIFIHNRDKESIQIFKDMMNQRGVPVVLIKMIGRTNASDYKNDCDSAVDEIPYHIVVDNTGSLDDLKEQARLFLSNAACYIKYILPKLY